MKTKKLHNQLSEKSNFELRAALGEMALKRSVNQMNNELARMEKGIMYVLRQRGGLN